jgi:hypothetical protein
MHLPTSLCFAFTRAILQGPQRLAPLRDASRIQCFPTRMTKRVSACRHGFPDELSRGIPQNCPSPKRTV